MVAFCGIILALGRWNLQMSRCKCPGVPRGQPSGWPLISALIIFTSNMFGALESRRESMTVNGKETTLYKVKTTKSQSA